METDNQVCSAHAGPTIAATTTTTMAPTQSRSAIKPKRYHGYAVVLFIFGTLFPPLAVAARFGIGSDFWINLLLTICGYFPGHGHNFYIQNVRNNKNHTRTPKWAQRYGLVDTSTIKRHEQRSQWASRYNDRNPHSTLEDQPYEAGQHSSPPSRQSTTAGQPQRPHDDLWHQDEESYYNADRGSNSVRTTGSGSGRWHYPANFEDTVPASGGSKKKKKKDKKDRWARTEDAYSLSEQSGSKKRKKKKSKSSVGDGDGDTYSRRSDSTSEFPEDAEGGLYDSRRDVPEGNGTAGNGHAISTTDDVFSHEL